MRFVPPTVSRKLAEQTLLVRKHSPTILFGAGMVSMVGSTVLACRATLKLEEVMEKTQTDLKHDLKMAEEVREKYPDRYSEEDQKQDVTIIYIRSAAKIAKLYAPSVILGGVGIACLTKSHILLRERNAALAAAYLAVDRAFRIYRERVVERYGEDTDREFRYGAETVDLIDEETGKVFETVRVNPGEPSGYARWFDDENSLFTKIAFDNNNWVFLRHQQNWANDMLRARGHLFLNEVYAMLGFPHTSPGAVVGWVYDRVNDDGDNYVDFGCWDENGQAHRFFEGMNGREGAILLDFNVDGPIWQLLDERGE